MKINWFKDTHTLEELRKAYRKLAMLHHPDKGGNTANMQQINAEYDYLSKNLIESNTGFSEGRKYYEQTFSADLKSKINEVINIPDVTIEVIGSWIWITGNTRTVKEQLKASGFTFSHNKAAWFWHSGEYRKNNGAVFNIDDIRQMWGSQTIESEEEEFTHSRIKAFLSSVCDEEVYHGSGNPFCG